MIVKLMEEKMKIAVYILTGIFALMAAVDIVYIFGFVMGDIRSVCERKLRKKYSKEK